EGWHCVVGDQRSIAQLADEIGFSYAYDRETKQYAHPSGVIVLTPEGKISRYIFGATFDARELRDALITARDGESTLTLSKLFLEGGWTVGAIVLGLGLFSWGALTYFRIERRPTNAIEVQVVGKQWMWKLQHAEGKREIDELHVPVNRTVVLTMTSQDVIHSFFVPAFRVKQDVVPGRYTSEWFKAIKPGEYHLFCAEYCGTQHSGMIGRVVVMEPRAYEEW